MARRQARAPYKEWWRKNPRWLKTRLKGWSQKLSDSRLERRDSRMVKDESSEVREAASLFRSALGKRDAAKVRSLCTRPERAHRTRGITNSITPVVQQAVDLLGERERSVRTRDVNEKGLVAFVESVSVEMKEYAADDHEWITAFVRDPASGEVLRLRKVGSKWLVDLGEG